MSLEPGQVLLRLGWVGTYVQTQHDDVDDVQDRGAIKIIHDQDIVLSEARLALDVGLSRRFSASLVLPVRVVSTGIRYLDARGMPVELVTPSTHHRNQTLTGLGDPMLLGAISEKLGGVQLTARAGFSLPLGRTEEDPFAMPDLPHEHIQLGTGTINPILAAEVAYGWAKWRAFAFMFTQQTVYENGKGYQSGDRYAAGLGVQRTLGRWSIRGTAEMQAESLERWHGVNYKNEGNQGRISVMAGAGAAWAINDRATLDATLKVPFVNHAVGGQLDMPALLEVGASWTFGSVARKPAPAHDHEDEHDHDHEGEHGDHDDHDAAPLDTKGGDIADLGANGAAVDLVPVPGKLTIFDFWATWCEPCKTLEPVLVELAKKNPARVALRRIDAVDWDSAVVAQHLTPRGFDLPHVKIYDASGKLVFEQSSGPGKLVPMIESIRAIVEPTPSAAVPPVPPTAPAETPTPVTPVAPIETPTPVTTPPPPPTKADAPPASKPVPAKPPAKPAVFAISATERGFEPGTITVPRNTPVTLRFTRKVERTCATEVAFEHDGKRELVALPLDKTVDLTITFKTPGTITYACAMNMFTGTIVVR